MLVPAISRGGEHSDSGTTLASLVSAVGSLSKEQYLNSYIVILGTTYITRATVLRPNWSELKVYGNTFINNPTSGVAVVTNYAFDSRGVGSIYEVTASFVNNRLQYDVHNDTLTSWELYWND